MYFYPRMKARETLSPPLGFSIYISDFLMFLSEKMRFFPKRKAE